MRVSSPLCRFLCISTLSVLVLVCSAFPSIAAAPGSKVSAAGTTKQLLLYAKNPTTWTIVKTGGNGKMAYHESSGVFTLTAAGLSSRTAYALIRYANDPPKADILGRGTSDEQGRLNLAGSWRDWTGKFWLVSGEDIVGNVGQTGSLRAWRPEKYLFEEKQLIGH